MSLEAKIEALTVAVLALTERMNGQQASAPAPVMLAQVAQPSVAPQVMQAPPAAPMPTAIPQMPQMPAAPSFIPQAPVQQPQQVAALPFSDAKGMLAYVMDSYKAMGQAKGAKIQGILQSMGAPNVNDVQPQHYAALFAQIEALKASA